MILLEVDYSFPISTTAMPPSTTGSNTPSHSMSSVLKLDWFVLVGMLLAGKRFVFFVNGGIETWKIKLAIAKIHA